MKRQKNVDGNTNKTKLGAASKADQGKKITKVTKKKAPMEAEVPDQYPKQAIIVTTATTTSSDTSSSNTSSGGASCNYNKKQVIKEANVDSVGISSGINVNNVNYMSNNCGVEGWEEYRGSSWLRGGVVDEQMSWGSSWMPFWDVEYMGEACCGEMFSDVMWDYDIWNLRHLDNVQNP